jgi:hypothetical protein
LHGRPLLQVRGPSACCQYDVVLHYRLSFYLLQSSRGKFGMTLSNQILRPVARIATCMVLRVLFIIRQVGLSPSVCSCLAAMRMHTCEQMIREKTKVEGSALKDFLLSCCCNALSLAQEARHLDANPYKGGEIIPLPMWRKCFKSCFPVQKRDERLLLSAREVSPVCSKSSRCLASRTALQQPLERLCLAANAPRCVRQGEMEKCRALLSAGANVNVRDGNENTPLMGAATYGMLETVDFLIKAKAELNAVDRIGATALVKVMALVPTSIIVSEPI